MVNTWNINHDLKEKSSVDSLIALQSNKSVFSFIAHIVFLWWPSGNIQVSTVSVSSMYQPVMNRLTWLFRICSKIAIHCKIISKWFNADKIYVRVGYSEGLEKMQ